MVLPPFRLGEELSEGLAIRHKHLVAHAGVEDIRRIMLRWHGDDGLFEAWCVVKVVFQHLEGDVAQVFVGDVFQQVDGFHLLAFTLGVLHEVGDGLVVAPGLFVDAA